MESGLLGVLQQAAYHPDVSEEVKNRALMFGSQCATGYIDLLEHVLLVGVPQPRERSFFAAHIYMGNEFIQVQI